MLAGLWSYRAFTTGDTSFSLGWLFPPKPEPRLGVMEEAKVDRVRRLVLIRRDDVEHLIMTGGPVDVVIETGIAAPRQEMRGRPRRCARNRRRLCSRASTASGRPSTNERPALRTVPLGMLGRCCAAIVPRTERHPGARLRRGMRTRLPMSMSDRTSRSPALALLVGAACCALLAATTPAAAQAKSPPAAGTKAAQAPPPAQAALPPEIAAALSTSAAALTEVEKALQQLYRGRGGA